MEYFAGIDIGGTKTLVGIVSETGELLTRRFETPKTDIESFLFLIRSNFSELYEEMGISADQVASVGVACPGLLDQESGIVIGAVNLDWSNFGITRSLINVLGISQIILEGDTRAALLAEHLARQEKFQNFGYLTVSTGIGLALMLDGKIWRGTNNFAGEIGQTIVKEFDILPGNRLESFASGKALEFSGGGKLESDEAAKMIASTIYNLYQLLDLELIVIGGGLGVGDSSFFPRVSNLLNDAANASRIGRSYPIEKSVYGTQSSFRGALDIARFKSASVAK